MKKLKKKLRKRSSAEQKALDLLKKLDKDNQFDSIEEELSKNTAMVEYYYNTTIGLDYPLLKFYNQLDQLQHFFKMDAQRFGLAK